MARSGWTFDRTGHTCTETLCDSSCTKHRKVELPDVLADEREPLIPETQQPSSHPPMRNN
ncbi:hypothetical protein PAXRUDRAFT_832351 [Paxillus rubicundulus Ve08.2h10]|uniref:Uncharacterized protein n=1 Tax=Paxillus rubicundulus Ve08.2h10 TaxID=930991 RepID=A0A0D0CHM3_9AGAM|nr:hypothetical protein PAXRUDRAFT_832351 [Paxillus rubicundulus Ve08.2h10]